MLAYEDIEVIAIISGYVASHQAPHLNRVETHDAAARHASTPTIT
jgi:hypothetical protein